MRQTGKTTLLAGAAKTIYRFDQEANILRFNRESESILNLGPFPILFDEVQKCPSVFDEVKARIDERRIPGRYLMTGSVRFSLKKQIRESMTGRMLILELLPLGISEAHQRPLSDFLPRIMKGMSRIEQTLEDLAHRHWATQKLIEHYLLSGGLPGICFSRDKVLRTEWMDAHIDTLVGRDLQQLYQSKLPHPRLRELLRLLALNSGQPINKSQLARELSTTVPTIGAHLEAFEALFLIRKLGDGYYLEDQGLASHLCRFDRLNALTNMRRVIYAELLQQLQYRYRSEAELVTYTSTSGLRVPFVFRFSNGSTLAFILDEGDQPSNSSLKTATWFQKKHGARSACLILHNGNQGAVIRRNTVSLPHYWLY